MIDPRYNAVCLYRLSGAILAFYRNWSKK